MGTAPVRVQCPISSSLGEFPKVLGLALVSWAFARVGIHRLSLRLPDLVFSIHPSSSAIGFYSCFFFTATHSVDPSLTHFLYEFPGLGLALIPDVVVPAAAPGFLSGLSPMARILSRGNPLGSRGHRCKKNVDPKNKKR